MVLCSVIVYEVTMLFACKYIILDIIHTSLLNTVVSCIIERN